MFVFGRGNVRFFRGNVRNVRLMFVFSGVCANIMFLWHMVRADAQGCQFLPIKMLHILSILNNLYNVRFLENYTPP